MFIDNNHFRGCKKKGNLNEFQSNKKKKPKTFREFSVNAGCLARCTVHTFMVPSVVVGYFHSYHRDETPTQCWWIFGVFALTVCVYCKTNPQSGGVNWGKVKWHWSFRWGLKKRVPLWCMASRCGEWLRQRQTLCCTQTHTHRCR